jgi:hypothetical protein
MNSGWKRTRFFKMNQQLLSEQCSAMTSVIKHGLVYIQGVYSMQDELNELDTMEPASAACQE